MEKTILNELFKNVDWEPISKSQKLSEDFIREFKDEVDWGWISEKQKILRRLYKRI